MQLPGWTVALAAVWSWASVLASAAVVHRFYKHLGAGKVPLRDLSLAWAMFSCITGTLLVVIPSTVLAAGASVDVNLSGQFKAHDGDWKTDEAAFLPTLGIAVALGIVSQIAGAVTGFLGDCQSIDPVRTGSAFVAPACAFCACAMFLYITCFTNSGFLGYWIGATLLHIIGHGIHGTTEVVLAKMGGN